MIMLLILGAIVAHEITSKSKRKRKTGFVNRLIARLR